MLTKKTPTPVEASWQDALARFDDWQRARGMGEKTRRAYGVDLAQLAEWAAGRDLEPGDLDPPGAAPLRGRRVRARRRRSPRSRASWPRSAPSTATWSSAASCEANPAELVSSPKKDAYLPQVLKPDEVAELLERIPASTPLDLRDRADVRAGLRGRAAGRGAREPRR